MTSLVFTHDTIKMQMDCAAVVALSEAAKLGGGVQVFTLGGKKAISTEFIGNPAGTGVAHAGLGEYMTEKGLKEILPCMEEILTDPAKEQDMSKWVTRVTYFVQ
jgi:effector-binding domain-containing protein